MPLTLVATEVATRALMPIVSPSEQDVTFRDQAVKAGMDKTRFILEATSLQVFTAHAAINTLRLSGSITAEQAQALVTESALAIHEQLENSTNYDVRLACPFPYTPAEFILERSSQYAQPQLFVNPTEQIPKLFAENCELQNSDVLQRIGWSLFAIRGNLYWEAWLRSVKII